MEAVLDNPYILTFPVSFGTNRIGVMALHCFDIEDGLSEIDLHLLQSFASQAANALYNAKLHTELQKKCMKLII